MWQKVHKLRGTICREEDIFSLVDRNVSSRKKTSLQTFSERLHFCWENYGKSAHAAVAKLISILIKQAGGGRMPTNSSRKRRCLHIVKLFSPLPPLPRSTRRRHQRFVWAAKKIPSSPCAYLISLPLLNSVSRTEKNTTYSGSVAVHPLIFAGRISPYRKRRGGGPLRAWKGIPPPTAVQK